MRIIFFTILFLTFAFSYQVKIDTTYDLNKLESKLNQFDLIEKLNKNYYSEGEVQSIKNLSQQDKLGFIGAIGKENAMMIKSQLQSLSNSSSHRTFQMNDIKNDIFKNLLKNYENFKIPIFIIFKMSYTNELTADQQLYKRINNNIMKHHSITFMDAIIEVNNGKFKELLKENKYGVIEATSNTKVFKREYLDNGEKNIIGIKKVFFYPFKHIKNKDRDNYKLRNSSNEDSIKIKLYEVNSYSSYKSILSKSILSKIKTYMSHQDIDFKKLDEKKKQYQLEISQLKDKYMKMLYDLYNIAPYCDNFFCFDMEIKKKFKTQDTDVFNKTYFFEYKLNPNRLFGSEYRAAVYEFIYALKPLVNVINNYKETKIESQNLSENKKQNILKRYFNGTEVGVYLKDGAPYLFFNISLKGNNENPCSDIFLTEKLDQFTKMKFNKYKMENGDEIMLSQTETTIQLFKRFLDKQKDQAKYFSSYNLYKKFKNSNPKNPISGLRSYGIISFIKWLNRQDSQYRLPTCKEWQYIASCGSKLKYCWGNEKETLNYNENIKANKKSKGRVTTVASFKKSKSNLYDMCGNVSEYCYVKENNVQRLRSIGGNYKTDQQEIIKIDKKIKGSTIGFRIIKIY